MRKKYLSIITLIVYVIVIKPLTAQWKEVNVPNNYNIGCLSTDRTNLYAGTYQNGIFVSTDNGISWKSINNNLPSLIIYDIELKDGKIYVGTQDGLYLTVNNGESWESRHNGITVSGSHGPDITIRSITQNNNYLFAGTYDEGIYRSSNEGSNWEKINSGLSWQYGSIVKNIVANDSCVLALMSGTCWRSFNNGESWERISPLIEYYGSFQPFISSIAEQNNYIYLGIYGQGLYVSNDFGDIWSKDVNELPNYITNIFINEDIFVTIFDVLYNEHSIYQLNKDSNNWQTINGNLDNSGIFTVTATNDYLFVYREKHGLWKRSILELTSINDNHNNTLSEFRLDQNYPNPYNPSTTIEYEIPSTSKVKIEVFDVLGREVELLLNKEQSAGNYKINFDGSKLNSGVYFYKITAGSYSQTKKMILVK